ncbi:MAG TPA: antibiotic ABC transporter [Albidovulum sp.]|uniref:antifreeze protein n=1 Tax=Albidovulum sp. TaxID=1872424 RepID=UPI002B5A8C63|nr:antibiotic ABC transporter [Albidovulum sp.]
MRNQGPLETGLEFVQLSAQMTMMLAEANMVIFMRVCGLAGFWNVSASEKSRMVREKTHAAQASARAAGRAMAAGESPTAIAQAALDPVRRRTKSNVLRLARRGPGMGPR